MERRRVCIYLYWEISYLCKPNENIERKQRSFTTLSSSLPSPTKSPWICTIPSYRVRTTLDTRLRWNQLYDQLRFSVSLWSLCLALSHSYSLITSVFLLNCLIISRAPRVVCQYMYTIYNGQMREVSLFITLGIFYLLCLETFKFLSTACFENTTHFHCP